MKIRLGSIQAFEDITYEFPDSGFVQIIGGNSNGKSVLGKVLKSIATVSFADQAERDALIQDGSEYGFVIISYRDRTLTVFMHTQRNQCYVTLLRGNGEEVTRTLREGGIESLMQEFGFRVYGKNSILLQVHETFGIAPFVNTSGSINYEIVDSVTTDTIAQQFLANFKGITHKTAKTLLEHYNSKELYAQKALSSLVMYDYNAYQKLHDDMEKLYPILKNIRVLEMKKLALVPKVRLIDIVPLRLPKIMLLPVMKSLGITTLQLWKIPLPKIVPTMQRLSCLSDTLSKLRKVREGTCPTCGRPLIECEEDL